VNCDVTAQFSFPTDVWLSVECPPIGRLSSSSRPSSPHVFKTVRSGKGCDVSSISSLLMGDSAIPEGQIVEGQSY